MRIDLPLWLFVYNIFVICLGVMWGIVYVKVNVTIHPALGGTVSLSSFMYRCSQRTQIWPALKKKRFVAFNFTKKEHVFVHDHQNHYVGIRIHKL